MVADLPIYHQKPEPRLILNQDSCPQLHREVGQHV